MAIADIPKDPAELSPEWLTDALQGGGATDARVASFDYEPIAAGVGFLGKLGRLRLHYAGSDEGLPRTLIVKQPTLDAKSRQLAMMFRFYEREVSFYQDIGSAAGIRIPTMHFGAADPKSGDFVLLMEDLAPARVGDQLAGCSAEDARSAVGALAKCHALWWRNPRLETFAWLPATNDPINHFAQFAYQGCWEPFVEFVGEGMTPGLRRTGEALATNVIRMLDGFIEMPNTLVHGDYRADNLFFGATGQDLPAPAAVDWQVSSRGAGAFDLAYFLSGNVSTGVRRSIEMDLLKHYTDILRENGVREYGFEACLDDYRFAVLFCLLYSVIVIGTLDPTNARGVAVFHANFERVAAAIADLDAGAMMPR
ncbi:MAG: ecdysteroid 22-kinase family protein [Reyranella sp.]|nr:ecdysteroid 22-kinase family protein [Reyranella sp.]